MKIAVISDIHANIYALMTAFHQIDDDKIDTIICLGDLVGYGPHPNEVVSAIRRRNILCIKGNYDSSVVDNEFSYIRETPLNSFSLPWTVNELREENREYIKNLPNQISLNIAGKDILFVHGSPNKVNEYLLQDDENTAEVMKNLKEDILICAHTHIPCGKHFDDKLLINCGSVGKPKLGRPNITYCVLNITEENGVSFNIKELEYDVHKIVKDMTMLDFPDSLVDSFKTGRE